MVRSYSLCILLVSLSLSVPATAQSTRRVSLANDGTQGNGDSFASSISEGGRYVAFESAASNLVAGDTNVRDDIFVRDTAAGNTTRVSISGLGVQGNDHSENPSISADGRYVAFLSSSTNLVDGDTNERDDVFVRDTVAGTTARVSVSSNGTQGNAPSANPAISADGRYVAFSSSADNLVAGDTNDQVDVFVRDTVVGTTSLVSVSTLGVQGDDFSVDPSVSSDGRYVAFRSSAGNLVLGDTNGGGDAFLRDTLLGTTTRVSVGAAGVQGSGVNPAISADGRYVAFSSSADNLAAGDANLSEDVFVRDTTAGTTARASVSGSSAPGNSDSGDFKVSISAAGRYIAFSSRASNLAPGTSNEFGDVFVRDTLAGTTTRVSVTTDGTPVDQPSAYPSISPDGRYVAFESVASNLTPGDSNAVTDVFVRDTAGGVPQYTVSDAAMALRLAGGLDKASAMDLSRLNLENGGSSQNRVDVLDAVRIARKASGLDPNP